MELTIPLFPCKSLTQTLDFYQTLGFEVTHQQEQPYLYAAVRRGEVELHFNSLTVWKSKNAVCLVMVPAVATYHQTFADALRTRYGKIPTAGYPRITRFRTRQTRFHLFDPSGNTLVYIDQSESDGSYQWSEATQSPLAQVLENAAFLRDTYCHDEAAARVLDKALAEHPSAEPLDRALVLAARAELAVALSESEIAQTTRHELRQIVLSDADRERYRDALQAADRLEQWLIQKPVLPPMI